MRCTQAEKEIHLARNIATWTVQKAAIHNFQGLVSKFQDDVALANSLNFSEGSGGYPGVIDKGAFWPSPFWRGKKSGCIWEAMLRHAFFGTDGKEFTLYIYEKKIKDLFWRRPRKKIQFRRPLRLFSWEIVRWAGRKKKKYRPTRQKTYGEKSFFSVCGRSWAVFWGEEGEKMPPFPSLFLVSADTRRRDRRHLQCRLPFLLAGLPDDTKTQTKRLSGQEQG